MKNYSDHANLHGYDLAIHDLIASNAKTYNISFEQAERGLYNFKKLLERYDNIADKKLMLEFVGFPASYLDLIERMDSKQDN